MKNRTCFFVFGYPPDYSGATTQAIKVSHELKSRNIETIFISYTFNMEMVASPVEDNKLYRFYRKRSGMVLYHLNIIRAFLKLRNNYDVIYLNGNDGQFWTAFYIAIFSKLFHKVMLMELNMEYEDPLCIEGTKFEMLKKIVAQWVDGYISLSSIIHQRMHNTHPQLNSQLLFNGVDINRFSPCESLEIKVKLRGYLNIPLDKQIVVTCGAICKRKGIDFLLNAWKKVIKSNKDVCLIFLGPTVVDGIEDAFTVRMIEQSKSPDYFSSIIFAGYISNVEEYLQAADIFVFAGRQEGSPNVLREAMAAGLPIVTLQLEGITDDMVDDGVNGYVIPVPDQRKLRDYANYDIVDPKILDGFASAILSILNDKGKVVQFGNSGREKACAHFSIKTQVDKLLHLIAESHK